MRCREMEAETGRKNRPQRVHNFNLELTNCMCRHTSGGCVGPGSHISFDVISKVTHFFPFGSFPLRLTSRVVLVYATNATRLFCDIISPSQHRPSRSHAIKMLMEFFSFFSFECVWHCHDSDSGSSLILKSHGNRDEMCPMNSPEVFYSRKHHTRVKMTFSGASKTSMTRIARTWATAWLSRALKAMWCAMDVWVTVILNGISCKREQVLWHEFYCFIHCYTFNRVQRQRHIVCATLCTGSTRAIHLFFDSKVFHFTIVLVIIVVILAFTKLNCFGRQTHSSHRLTIQFNSRFLFPFDKRHKCWAFKNRQKHIFFSSCFVFYCSWFDSIDCANSAIAQYASMGWR